MSDALTGSLGVLLNLEESSATGLAELAASKCVFEAEEPLQLVAGGMDLLPRAFLPRIGGLIQFRTKVVQVSYDDDKVRVR